MRLKPREATDPREAQCSRSPGIAITRPSSVGTRLGCTGVRSRPAQITPTPRSPNTMSVWPDQRADGDGDGDYLVWWLRGERRARGSEW